VQCAALAVLVCGATVASAGRESDPAQALPLGARAGIVAGLIAALLSGLASTMSQLTLQNRDRNTFLFGGEMAVYTITALIATTGLPVMSIFDGWTPGTVIPVASNAVGGLLVGLVTKSAGNVAKGYAIVAGILMTGFMEGILFSPVGIPLRLWIALPLVVGSTMLRVAAAAPLPDWRTKS
jgi:UDP-sugar transporter A1/2/3